MKPEGHRPFPGHLCQATPEERERVIGQLKFLIEKLSEGTCIPRPRTIKNTEFLYKKQPKFVVDDDSQPIIVSTPIFEMKPTSEYAKLKHTERERKDYYLVEVESIHNPRKSPPWLGNLCNCNDEEDQIEFPTQELCRKKSR